MLAERVRQQKHATKKLPDLVVLLQGGTASELASTGLRPSSKCPPTLSKSSSHDSHWIYKGTNMSFPESPPVQASPYISPAHHIGHLLMTSIVLL